MKVYSKIVDGKILISIEGSVDTTTASELHDELKKLRRAEDQIREELFLPPDEYKYHRMSIMKQKDEILNQIRSTIDFLKSAKEEREKES